MTTSRYSSVCIGNGYGRYIVIDRDRKEPYLSRRAFPIYSSDLVLQSDRYPEYELIKHLPCKDIFNYFIEDKNNVIDVHTEL